MGSRPSHRFFFVHVMKTAGTTLNAVHLAATFPAHEIYPDPNLDSTSYDLAESPYWRVDGLRELDPVRRAVIRAYTGHFPFCASELVGGPDLVTYTLLRDPVDRVVSYLKHCRIYHPQHRGLPFEAIYDDRDWMDAFAVNFQTRMFAFTADDLVRYCHQPLEIDDRRLAVAKNNLEATDVVGVQERFDDLVAELVVRYGWTAASGRPMRVGEPGEVSPRLRRRIEADNEADNEFYRYALDLVDRRAQRRPSSSSAKS